MASFVRIAMRRTSFLVSAAFVAASLSVTSIGAVAATSTRTPVAPGHHSGARSSPVHLPSTPTRVPTTVNSVAPVNCDAGFHTVASPNGTGNNYLISMSAVSANDVWAVGNSTTAGGVDQTLAEHWDGTSWTIFPTPNIGSLNNDLNAVIAISTTDVWAVGDYQIDTNSDFGTIAEHWTGTSWALVATANPTPFSLLLGVTAVSTSDVWAVGTYFDFTLSQLRTLVEQWNGTSWSLVSSPNPNAFDNELFGVSAFNSSDVWAVGEQSLSGQPFQSLAEHWNGTVWATITTPNLGGDNEIVGVNALEAGHAVGVGYGNFISGTTPRQSEGWDLLAGGTSTSTNLTSAGLGSGDNALIAVDRSAGSVWAVGYSRATVAAPRQTLAIPATWNAAGHSLTWGSAPGTSDSPGATNSVFEAVTAVSPYAFWAAGYENNNTVSDQTLTESYCARNFTLTGPGSTPANAAFSVTVTVKNGNGTTATAYGGTVHFTSSDGSATLPAAYMFVPGDNGSHTFTGVVLRTAGSQTITVADAVMPLTVPASATIMGLGASQAPAGTAGSRNTNQGPAGTQGTRAANQSGAGTPGPRLPRLGPVARSVNSGSGITLATAIGPAPTVGAAGLVASSGPAAAAPLAAADRQGFAASLASEPLPPLTARGAAMVAPAHGPATRLEYPSHLPVIVITLAIASLALLAVRRRKNRRLIGNTRP